MLLALVLAATTLFASQSGPTGPVERPFHVIVNASNPIASIGREELSAIFMKKLSRWPSGADVVPIDQLPESSLRERFSRLVHGKSTGYVIRYWHRLIFAGRAIPPREAQNDAAVIDLVRTQRGAIGYVSSRALLPEGVKTIEVRP
jgi:ABC-type phosphate transport system substrate-binding protein